MDMMRNSLLPLSAFILVLALLLMSGCIRTAPPQAPTLVEQNQSCERLSDPTARDSCFFDAAVNFGSGANCASVVDITHRDDCYAQVSVAIANPDGCMSITDESKKTACFSGVATAKNQASICSRIADSASQSICLQSLSSSVLTLSDCQGFTQTAQVDCRVALAKNLKLTNTCDDLELESERDDCLNRSAREANLIDLCTRISSEAESNSCISDLIGGNISPAACPLLESLDARDACFGQLATQLNDSTYCGRVVGIASQNNCWQQVAILQSNIDLCGRMKPLQVDDSPTDSCYDAIGRSLKNTLICYKVKNQAIQDACIDDVVGPSPPKGEDCAAMTKDSNEFNTCYANLAVLDQNIAACNWSGDKTGCVVAYSLSKDDPAYCKSSFLKDGNVFDCQSRYYVETNDAVGCDSIAYSDWRYTCYTGLAIKRDDNAFCAKIPSTSIKPYATCWVGLANLRGDLTLCDKSQDRLLKARCYAQVGSILNNPDICEQVPVTNAVDYQRYYYRNACWIELAQISKSPGYCLNIDLNSKAQYQACDCALNGNCQTIGSLTVTVSSPADDDLGGYLVVLTRNSGFFADYAVHADTMSAVVPSLPDGNYGVVVSDTQRGFETDLQTLEVLNAGSYHLNFVMRAIPPKTN